MSQSQFTIYSASDINAPVLNGISGSLLNVLDACLVNGYGSKQPAGWSKPFGTDPTMSIAAYIPASGSRMTLIVNDNNPTGSFNSAFGMIAWWNGWETLIGLTGSINTSMGSGSGNFPIYGQNWGFNVGTAGNTPPISASFSVQKSSVASNTQRFWIMFADAHTMHLFINAFGTSYSHYHFGDIFSLKGKTDMYKTWLTGKNNCVISSDTNRFFPSDILPTMGNTQWTTAMPRGVGGNGTAVEVNKTADQGKTSVSVQVLNPSGNSSANQSVMSGNIPLPNPVDNSLYISPVWIIEPFTNQLRGRVRGMWQVCHPAAGFSDGQIIYGANEQIGKIFQIVAFGNTSGFWAMEISPTVETN